jgi:1,4-alpha-glucan branching enzyme
LGSRLGFYAAIEPVFNQIPRIHSQKMESPATRFVPISCLMKAIRTKTSEGKKVRFEFYSPCAKNVFVAGTFNNWHPAVTEMIALSDGHWAKEVILPPGSYQYRFVADGQWISDSKAPETQNGFGETNSVITVERPT